MSLFERVLNEQKTDESSKTSQKKKQTFSAAGAVPVLNAKGEISMEPVKIKRYVAGKMPIFAENHEIEQPKEQSRDSDKLRQPKIHIERTKRDHGKRQVFEPQIVESFASFQTEIPEENDAAVRRAQLRQKLLEKQKETVFVKQEITTNADRDIQNESSSPSESESEIEVELVPRLKPIFVSKNKRITIPTEDISDDDQHYSKINEQIEQRKNETKEILAELIKKEESNKDIGENEADAVITDDDDEETAFEQWKVRELKRIKRDLEAQEAYEAERQEIQRLHIMTDEEREQHFKANPRLYTNKGERGVYKYLQKYYHRGAFYLDEETPVLNQNFDQPTLEDLFDKELMPKIMQVKNFGKAGRTKYTHLVDQDTSDFIGPYSKKNELAVTFPTKIGGGFKQVFDRPSLKRKK